MLNAIIRFSLHNRILVMTLAALLCAFGLYTAARLPTDVLPDINRPTVTIITEAPGLAPEEVETLITYPVETAINGAAGVERVRSVSGLGLSMVSVEFGWNTDLWPDRQVVQERLGQIRDRLPDGVVPLMGPVNSLMGEIMLVGMRSDALSPMDIRTLAEWVVRPALLSVPGVSQVSVIGGDLKEFQVRADPEKLRLFNLTLEDLEQAVARSNTNTGGGFLVGPNRELVVRNIGRIQSIADLEQSLVAMRQGKEEGQPRPIYVRDVATVFEAGRLVKRGDGSMNGRPAVIMAVQKQPAADTVHLTRDIDKALEALKPSLPPQVVFNSHLFRQAHFIERAMDNIRQALRDGGILVLIVLVLFLLNVRTTAITLTAIPLSLTITALVFKAMGLTLNTMTLGGIAVAIGELVDDAIVDVENVFRRLRENRDLPAPRPALQVIYDASREVRGAILYGTSLVLLVFLPLFALPGIEGRIFKPLALGYIISILASLIIALTVTPVLCYYLLPKARAVARERETFVLRTCKALIRRLLNLTLPRPRTVLAASLALAALALWGTTRLGTDFLPPFNEGTATVFVSAVPGTSLPESNRLGTQAEQAILTLPEVKSTSRRTGRAEQDEHAEGINLSEIEVEFWSDQESRQPDRHVTPEGRTPPARQRPRSTVLADIRNLLQPLPGATIEIGAPLSHRIDVMLSGVRADVAVKIFGEDFNTLRRLAEQAAAAIKNIPGVTDLVVEQQTNVTELHLHVLREPAARLGFTSQALADAFETAMKGRTVGQILDGQRSFDLVVMLDRRYRENVDALLDLRLISPTGAVVLLRDVAQVHEHPGPNRIGREDVRRRIIVQCNVRGRDLGTTVNQIENTLASQLKMPVGYSLRLEGTYESQKQATRIILGLSALSLLAMVMLIYHYFRSPAVVMQILLNIPLAFVGSVVALYLTGQSFNLASLVGFISLCGIASRHGVLMVSHYQHLCRHEGMTFGREMVLRGTLERVAPILMTALTAGLALVPLAREAGQPGKEILYPVAVTIIGGLVTCTLVDFLVTPAVFLRFGRKAASAAAGDDLPEPPDR